MNNRKVDFIGCGAMKCGTTALKKYLQRHPQVCIADVGEVHYFDYDVNFPKNGPSYDTYHKHFNPGDKCRAVGEITPKYMFLENVPKRLWEYNPDLKLVVLLRHPVERTYSHYHHMLRNRKEEMSFRDFINKCLNGGHFAIKRGRYLEQLRRIWKFFPREQVFVRKTKDLLNEPHVVLDDLCSFVGVDAFKWDERYGTVNKYGKMSQRDREFLMRIFKHEVGKLEDELGWERGSL